LETQDFPSDPAIYSKKTPKYCSLSDLWDYDPQIVSN